MSVNKIRQFLKALGPGIITGASDDDPSGIATYSQAGAQLGFGALWTALFTIPLMSGVQEMCARIGLVTENGLSGNLKKFYPRWVLFLMAGLILSANTINIGADIAGMAAATHLLIPLPNLIFVAVYSLLIVILMIVLPYDKLARIFKWLTLALLAYLAVPFVIQVNWGEIFRSTFIPNLSLDKSVITLLVAILGTTISPYLFFWQANMEVEEEIEKKHARGLKHWVVTKHEIRLMEQDVSAGMILSNVVMWFIIITAGATLFTHGITNIDTADQAAQALKPIAGDAAYLLFALGIIGTGLLAIPVLAGSASYVLSETLGWTEGLEKSFSQAKGFYAVIILSTLIGASLSFTSLSAFQLLFYTAVIYGLISPPLIGVIMVIANNEKIMGTRKNGKLSNTLCGLGLATMTVAAVALIWTSFF